MVLIAHIKNLPGETEPFPPESVQIHKDSSSFSSSSSSPSSSLGDQDGDRGSSCPLPKVPPCHGHPAASPSSASLARVSPARPPWHSVPTVPPTPRVQELIWGWEMGGKERVVWEGGLGPFGFSFRISVHSSLSLFPRYKMSWMVMASVTR